MKRLLSVVLSVISAFAVTGFTACAPKNDFTYQTLEFYVPDGAPALSVAKFISDGEDFGLNAVIKYNVVSADKIGGTMQTGKGDVIIMPVNAASKLYKAHSAENPYKMAGVITHGNLYVMAKEELTLSDLIGKVVGVVNLPNVPGLTFKSVLSANGIAYRDAEEPAEGVVSLKDYDGTGLVQALKQNAVQVGILPEPAANKLTQIASGYTYALDIQELYDAQAKAYPQAVLMVKNSVLKSYPNFITELSQKLAGAVAWVKEDPEAAVFAVSSALEEGVTPSFNAGNLNAAVVDNCKIFWQSAESAKASVTAYINGIIAITANSAKAVGEDFFA